MVPNPQAASDPSGVEHGRAILIAEDDAVFRRILEAWLGKWGYAVTATSDGQQAWEVLQREDAPKLAILDWMMPGMYGTELCRKVRTAGGPYRYLLLLTAKTEKHDVIAGLEAGADDYLSKPFDSNELRARLRVGQRILDLQDQLIAAQDALRFQATHDSLTGLLNHGAILDALHRELERGKRMQSTLGLIMVDIDHFKTVNDTLGHLAGDEVLHAAAQRLVSAVRAYDSVGRCGGEEFIVLAPGCLPPELVTQAERMRTMIASDPFVTSAGQIRITASFGVVGASVAGEDKMERDALLRAADAALYQAKSKGRNRVECAPMTAVAAH
ncbi:MAG TPA: diguanylate cyclase [Acidobacteriaceae bacterium]|nr:diguanylate cyclase [Acidobacteriaceae bacterium]